MQGARRLRRIGAGVAVVIVALAGCGSEPDTRQASPTPTATTAVRTTSASGPDPTAAPGPTAAPSPIPAADCTGVDREVLATDRPLVAVTVDLGGDAAGLPSILSTLSRESVTATFFVTGNWAERHPEDLRRIAAAGHPIGNHSQTHPQFTQLTPAQVAAELSGVEEAVVALTGQSTKPLFRFPFGDRDAAAIDAVNDNGYCAYRWTVDTLGWKGTSGGITASAVVDRVMSGLQPGEIVLMHGGANPDDGSTLDADALPEVIRLVREQGYSFTTLPSASRPR